MKNIIKSSVLLLFSLLALAACSDDRDSNPTVQSPTTFSLNTPVYASSTIDLASSSAINFSWSQPDYGFPAVANYQIEFSLNNSWKVSTTKARADKSGKTIADYTTIEDVYNICKAQVNAAKIARGLEMIAKWEEGKVPATQKVYARCVASYAGDTISSNVVTLIVAPYYVEVKDHAPVLWYMTGNCIANGKWGNSEDAVGVSMIPLLPLAGEEYDVNTGTGTIGYTGYFSANAEFKIIEKLGSWDKGICSDGSPLGTKYRDGGSDPGNIKIDQAGYYSITLNTKTHACTIKKLTATTMPLYAKMAMPGSYQPGSGWDPTANFMKKCTTAAGVENHDWTATVTLDTGHQLQFAANGALTDTWSASDFPYGTGVKGGTARITVIEPGKYTVFFNDITGQYYFLK